MAKRSDFAQKLLDDLRLRKERLASSSQSSNHSNSSMAIIDAYSYAKQNFRGSKHIRTNDMINGSRTQSSSQQIVPYNNNGRSQSSHQRGNFSLALSFALEKNGGKINGTRGNREFPAFSTAQIEEISIGVQRLNQILKACSAGGVNFDRRTVQIGKELLRGALDLENSLKTLSVTKPGTRKSQSRIRLVEDEEGNEIGSNLAKEWELNRPRFPFFEEEEPNQRPKAKARIPNVIAKLMGLEKLPEEEEEEEERTVRIRANRERLAVQAKPFVVNASFAVMADERLRRVATKKNNEVTIVKKNIEASNSVNQSLKQSSRVMVPKKSSSPNKNKSLKKCTDSKDELFGEKISAESRRYKDARNRNVEYESNHRRRRDRVVNELPRTRSTRQQSSVLKEVKPTTKREKLNVMRSEAKSQRLIVAKEVEKRFDVYGSREGRVKSFKGPETLPRNDDFVIAIKMQCQTQNVTSDDQLKNQATFCGDRELKCCVVISDNELDETTDTHSTEPEPSNNEKTTSTQIITITKPAEPIILALTETENRLKQILVKSQLFLNTAEALFKLNIPITTLHSSSTNDNNTHERQHHNEQRNDKLLLDCGYELMRRKGRRQELTVHHNRLKTTSSVFEKRKIRNLECLVRELNEDFEKLRMYGRDYGNQVEEYLAGMQVSDVAGKGVVDVNCMWDLGWNDSAFAFVEVDEVVRDVEKFVLNCLLDQITADIFFYYV